MAIPHPMTAWQTHSSPHAWRALGSELVPPAGVEPATPTLGNDRSGAVSVDGQELTTVPPRPPADSPAVEQRRAASECEEVRSGEGELKLVVQAWGDLAPPLKAAILAMVRAASEDHAR